MTTWFVEGYAELPLVELEQLTKPSKKKTPPIPPLKKTIQKQIQKQKQSSPVLVRTCPGHVRDSILEQLQSRGQNE